MPNYRTWPFLLPALVCLSGCVPNRIYRPGSAAIQDPPVLSGSSGHFKLGVIEFDDMGESWEKCTSLTDPSNCQLTRTLDLIRREKQAKGDVVVVVFVHGWKNNASLYNESEKNLHDFKIVMERLASGESDRLAAVRTSSAASGYPLAPRSYIGIYMAWRGQAVAGDIITTFGNRRDTAEHVGSSDFAEAVYRIMNATKQGSPNSRVVIVGHSFGARALETALTNTFVSLLIPRPQSSGTSSPAEVVSPADLILYVNSANDSFRTKQMIELMKRTNFRVVRDTSQHLKLNGQQDKKYDGPLFLSVTSTGDSATGTAFPLAQNLSAPWKNFRHDYGLRDIGAPNPPPQKVFFTHTPGHIPYLISHQLHSVAGECIPNEDIYRFSSKGQCYSLDPVPNRWNDSAFWDVTVPPSIIRDHSDIFNPSFTTMIIGLLDYYSVLNGSTPTTMARTQ